MQGGMNDTRSRIVTLHSFIYFSITGTRGRKALSLLHEHTMQQT
jgi:hypothetical protein